MMTPTSTTGLEVPLVHSLRAQLQFQRKWQRLSMLAYVSSTVGILICSTIATLAAAKGWNELAAYLAAGATILVGLEKSLLFREKWKFHLAIATRLAVLLAEIDTKKFDEEKILEEYSSVLKSYAESIPISGRENA